MLKVRFAQRSAVTWTLGFLIAAVPLEFTHGEERDPICIEASATSSLENQFHSLNIEPSELLARLVWAESESLISGPTALAEKCEAQFVTYAKAIAWTVRARVELAKRNANLKKKFGSDWYGVVFKKDQFNPAVSKKSNFRKFFVCPQKSTRFLKYWFAVRELADKVTDKHTLSPLVTTPFERSEGYSLIAHLYYPLSLQATTTPPTWVTQFKQAKQEVRSLKLDGLTLNNACLWMFREKAHE
ncbi:MAG: hypothetical protein K2X47_04130 [Bdellovibrionales bacterium]|nr:hypothetical protein [Bdellovibrionales bacterium]